MGSGVPAQVVGGKQEGMLRLHDPQTWMKEEAHHTPRSHASTSAPRRARIGDARGEGGRSVMTTCPFA
jgi:hypothetical protein